MQNTQRIAVIATAAALIAGAVGGCATAGQPATKRASLANHPFAAAGASPTTHIAMPTTPPTTPPTPPVMAPNVRAAAPPTGSIGSNSSDYSATLAAERAPCQATAVACVSLSRQEAWLLHDGKVVFGPVPVATGRESLPTPAGIFHVMYKIRNSWSAPYQAWMPWAVYFYGGDAFHEDPVTVRSHGCVHLSAGDAQYFYNYLQVGNEVQVAY